MALRVCIDDLRRFRLHIIPYVFLNFAGVVRAQVPPVPEWPGIEVEKRVREDSAAARAARGPVGAIAGVLRDRATQQPLAWATVEVPLLSRATSADRYGAFSIRAVPPGVYTVRVRHVGYATSELPDVRVRQAKTTDVVLELDKRDLRADKIVVRSDPFVARAATPASRQDLSSEEVRRSPGSAADIARTVQALPGVAHTSDQNSDLVVRGGAPTENLTLLDDVPIPNANHFPEYGGAGGAISMLNIDLVRGVAFYTGGFPVQHGDKLSSVLEVKMRDGNREGFAGAMDLSIAGAGLVLEGPLGEAQHGSWIVNGRRSYVDLIADQLNTRTTPQYSDVQGKVAWTPNTANTLSVVGIAGFDKVTLDDQEDAYSRGFDFVDARQTQYAGGLTWKRLLGNRGHALVTAHRSENNHLYDVRDRRRAEQEPVPVYLSDVFEAETGLRARTTVRLRPATDVTFGGELRRVRFSHDITAAADTAQGANPTARPDSVGLVVQPRNEVQTSDAGNKGALFASVEQRLPGNLAATLGLRWDRFDFGGQEDWSPRAGLTWRPNELWTVRTSAGYFHQTPYTIQLTQTEASRWLPMQRAAHLVLGCDRRLGRGTQATVEAYLKEYADLPVAPSLESRELVAAGSGRVQGIEMFVQQRLLTRWYGLASYALSKSERTDLVHGTFADEWDARHVLTLLAGVRPRTGWEFSARWRFVSGRPFTDFTERFEVAPSGVRTPGSGYFVGFEGPYNGGRLSAYHRLDLRADYRRQLGRFHLVTFVDVENVYDRDNVLVQRFSHDRAEPEAVYQWKLLPVIGLSLEF